MSHMTQAMKTANHCQSFSFIFTTTFNNSEIHHLDIFIWLVTSPSSSIFKVYNCFFKCTLKSPFYTYITFYIIFTSLKPSCFPIFCRSRPFKLALISPTGYNESTKIPKTTNVRIWQQKSNRNKNTTNLHGLTN